MKTFITTDEDLKSMVKAMRVAGLTIEKTSTTYKVEVHGKVMFRAIKGSNKAKGTWLVRHHKELFV
tara:strand:+ start:45 stop:242 length:198 start_codon:yes stop_codon:yes gene_type:complete